jgi:hypothetical protein
MIRVHHPISKPAQFDQRCEGPGLDWLGKNPNSERMPAHWTKFQTELADGFSNRCGWWAMWIADGAVDHFLSRKHYRHLAYSWDNYRYIAGTVNSSKKTLDDQVLDPFEVQDGWFEVLLPSMQLVTTLALPAGLATKATFTLKKLHLQNGAKVRRCRHKWYESYKAGNLSMAGLEDFAPLVATAVKNWQTASLLPLP